METDSDFNDVVDPAEARPLNGRFRIIYVDGDGDLTDRVIERCRILTHPPHEFLIAHCRLRRADRLFRLDRITEMFDADTGEALTEFQGRRFGDAYEAVTSMYPPDDPLRSARFDLDVLTFVAALSSKMRESQVAVIVDYLERHLGMTKSDDLVRQIKRHRVPGPEEFRQSMKAVPRSRADVLIATAQAVLDKVKRAGELDRGVMAMLAKRKDLIGNYARETDP